jgi:hypothetical protein
MKTFLRLHLERHVAVANLAGNAALWLLALGALTGWLAPEPVWSISLRLVLLSVLGCINFAVVAYSLLHNRPGPGPHDSDSSSDIVQLDQRRRAR